MAGLVTNVGEVVLAQDRTFNRYFYQRNRQVGEPLLAFLPRSRLIRASAVFRNLIFYGFDWPGNVVYYIECLIAVSAGKVAQPR